jgi:hypothetical protein
MGSCHGHQTLVRRHRKFPFEASRWPATSTEFSVSIARRLTGSAGVLFLRKKFLLRTRIRKKAFALGLFAGEFAGSSDRLIALPRRSFGRLLVEPSELHLPKDAFPLHFLFEDPERLVDVVVANQDLQAIIPSLR